MTVAYHMGAFNDVINGTLFFRVALSMAHGFQLYAVISNIHFSKN